jgi:hypothetical protein
VARRGVFGRRPRAAPSLTATIVAIAQAMQAANDRNITDAWEKGGMYKGAPVTDDMILEHWRGRLKGISPKDPLYDQYSNTVTQFEFSIAESKISTSYAQGKTSAAAMSNFYLDWAKKIPQDSEFYRVFQRNAARFIQSVRTASSGSRRASASSARESAATDVKNKYERVGDYLTSVFTYLAKVRGLIQMDKTLTNDFQLSAPRGGLTDPEKMREIIADLNAAPGETLMMGPNGPITGQMVLDEIKRLDPSFSGELSSDYFANALRQKWQGLQLRLAQATTKTEQNAIIKEMTDTGELARQSGTWDTAEAYMAAKRTWQAVAGGFASPDELVQGWENFQQALGALITDPKNPVDDFTREKIVGEMNLDPSMPTWQEAFIGTETVNPERSKPENAILRANLEFAYQQRELVAAQTHVWAFGGTTGKGEFGVPTGFELRPGGNRIGAVPIEQAQKFGAQVAFVPQSAGLGPAMVYVAPMRIETVMRNPATGKEAKISIPSNVVGSVFDAYFGGEKVRLYQYVDALGTTRYTTESPWDTRAVLTQGKDGTFVLDVSSVPGVALTATKDANGAVKDLIYDPRQAFDAVRNAAGVNPQMDYLSPTIAWAQSGADGAVTLYRLQNDPNFRAVVEAEARAVASAGGVIPDPASGLNRTPMTAEQKYAAVMSEYQMAVNSVQGYENDAIKIGQRYNPQSFEPAFTSPSPQGVPSRSPTRDPVGEFGNLAEYMNRQYAAPVTVPNLLIKTPTELTVPGYTAPPVAPTQMYTMPFEEAITAPSPTPWVAPLPQNVTNVAPAPVADPFVVPLADEYYGGSPPPTYSR